MIYGPPGVGIMARTVHRNGKCDHCLHFDRQLAQTGACVIGEQPANCGDGDHPTMGFAPFERGGCFTAPPDLVEPLSDEAHGPTLKALFTKLDEQSRYGCTLHKSGATWGDCTCRVVDPEHAQEAFWGLLQNRTLACTSREEADDFVLRAMAASPNPRLRIRAKRKLSAAPAVPSDQVAGVAKSRGEVTDASDAPPTPGVPAPGEAPTPPAPPKTGSSVPGASTISQADVAKAYLPDKLERVGGAPKDKERVANAHVASEYAHYSSDKHFAAAARHQAAASAIRAFGSSLSANSPHHVEIGHEAERHEAMTAAHARAGFSRMGVKKSSGLFKSVDLPFSVRQSHPSRGASEAASRHVHEAFPHFSADHHRSAADDHVSAAIALHSLAHKAQIPHAALEAGRHEAMAEAHEAAASSKGR